jgi:C1A family cysteine protease
MHFLLLALAAVLCSAEEFIPKNQVVTFADFQDYIQFWNKTYTADEKPIRLQNFLNSAGRIAELNKDSDSARFGFTQFADMSRAEFKAKMTGFKTDEPLNTVDPTTVRLAAPSGAIDWVAKGKTTPIKNQEQCGSCWAFSATETVESANLMAGRAAIILAPQEIVDCDSGEAGCNGGDPRQALDWVKSVGGQERESCYPYTARNGACERARCTPAETVATVYAVPGNEASIYDALTRAPLSICADAEPWQFYTGGILKASQCGLSIDHAIQLVGYSPNSGGYWIVRNSWGASWGERGYIYLQYGHNTCGITSRVTGATA